MGVCVKDEDVGRIGKGGIGRMWDREDCWTDVKG